MKWLIIFIISAFTSTMAISQEYRIIYDGLPELYNQVYIIVEKKDNSGNYNAMDKGFKIETKDGQLKGNQFTFNRQYIQNKGGRINFTVTIKKQSKEVQLLLPVIQEIKFNLYADSIKPILNYYLNVEGVYSNGRIYPLDTNFITITCSSGTILNTEWIKPKEIDFNSVTFNAVYKYNTAIKSSTEVYIKKGKND